MVYSGNARLVQHSKINQHSSPHYINRLKENKKDKIISTGAKKWTKFNIQHTFMTKTLMDKKYKKKKKENLLNERVNAFPLRSATR